MFYMYVEIPLTFVYTYVHVVYLICTHLLFSTPYWQAIYYYIGRGKSLVGMTYFGGCVLGLPCSGSS